MLSRCYSDINPPVQDVETNQLIESEVRIDRGKGRARERGKGKVYNSPMADCKETTLCLKWHVLHQHDTDIFNEDLTPDSSLSNRRYAALSILAKGIDGPSARVKDLAATLNRFKLIGVLLEIQTNQERVMRAMCSVMSCPSLEVFSSYPVNSPACLIH